MTDREDHLVDQALEGDRQAASELVQRHYAAIYAYLRRLGPGPDDAEDLTQLTYMKAWKSLSTYARKARFSTWLHGIAYHTYVDWRRRHRPEEIQDETWWGSAASCGLSPCEKAEEHDTAQAVFRWVDVLDPELRHTIHLHYYQGLSIAETAEVMRVSASTVKYRLRIALDRIRAGAARSDELQPSKST